MRGVARPRPPGDGMGSRKPLTEPPGTGCAKGGRVVPAAHAETAPRLAGRTEKTAILPESGAPIDSGGGRWERLWVTLSLGYNGRTRLKANRDTSKGRKPRPLSSQASSPPPPSVSHAHHRVVSPHFLPLLGFWRCKLRMVMVKGPKDDKMS